MKNEKVHCISADTKNELLFAKILDKHASMQGRLLMSENKRIKKDPSAIIPYELNQRVLSTLRSELKCLPISAEEEEANRRPIGKMVI